MALQCLNPPTEALGDDVFSKETHIAFAEGIKELCMGQAISSGKFRAGDTLPSTQRSRHPPSGSPGSGHGGPKLPGLQLRIRGLHVEEVDQACAGGRVSPGAIFGRQHVVFIPQRPGVKRVGLGRQGEDVLEGGGGVGSTVGVPHGEGDGAGPGLPRAPAARQVPAHGPLEVPHEERVDDGVHGAVAVTQPGEHVKEAGGDAAAGGLAGLEP